MKNGKLVRSLVIRCYDIYGKEAPDRIVLSVTESIPTIIGQIISTIEQNVSVGDEISDEALVEIFARVFYNLNGVVSSANYPGTELEVENFISFVVRAIVEHSIESSEVRDEEKEKQALLNLKRRCIFREVYGNNTPFDVGFALSEPAEFESIPDFSSIMNRLIVEGVKLDFESERNMVAAEMRRLRMHGMSSLKPEGLYKEFIFILDAELKEFGYTADDRKYLREAAARHKQFLLRYFR